MTNFWSDQGRSGRTGSAGTEIHTIPHMCFHKFKMFRNFIKYVNIWIMLKTCESFLEKHGNSKIECFINLSHEHVDF